MSPSVAVCLTMSQSPAVSQLESHGDRSGTVGGPREAQCRNPPDGLISIPTALSLRQQRLLPFADAEAAEAASATEVLEVRDILRRFGSFGPLDRFLDAVAQETFVDLSQVSFEALAEGRREPLVEMGPRPCDGYILRSQAADLRSSWWGKPHPTPEHSYDEVRGDRLTNAAARRRENSTARR